MKTIEIAEATAPLAEYTAMVQSRVGNLSHATAFVQ